MTRSGERVEDENPEQRGDGSDEIGPRPDAEALASHDDSCQSSERCDVDQFEDRRDDRGRERRLGS